MKKIHFVFLSLILFSIGCDRVQVDTSLGDCDEEVVYETMTTTDEDVKRVIDRSCAYVGCHDGFTQQPDYTSYANMNSSLISGQFKERVVDIEDMPPSYAVDSAQLDSTELNLLKCWISGDFKQF